MKRKKIMSGAVAGMLVAAQMVMPVSATSDGTLAVTVDIVKPVIRVQVPTALAVAVNQFEKGEAGNQIKSGEFTMINKSDIPVKVTVNSEVTLGTDPAVTLVDAKKKADESTENEAWLAVAAQVVAGKYVKDTTKGIKDLTEADKNVATFATASGDSTAKQIFYLAAVKPTAPATSPAASYKVYKAPATATTAGYEKLGYVTEFYALTKLTKSGNASAAPENADLTNALSAGPVYTVGIFGADSTATPTEVPSNTTAVVASTDYYTVATSPTTNVTKDKLYLFKEAADGDKTAFRYIGRLSPAKDSWTNSDISTIEISYDIDGVAQDDYEAMKTVCPNLGLYESLVGRAAVNGNSVMSSAAGSTAITSKTGIVTKLKKEGESGNVQFVLKPEQLMVAKTEGLTVQKVKVMVTGSTDVSDCTFTAVTNPDAAANTDGNRYAITLPNTSTAVTSIDYIEVLYGTADNGPYMTVKYAFTAQ